MKLAKITTMQLKKATRNVRNESLTALAHQEEYTHDFSQEFEKKMEILLIINRERQKKKRRNRSIAAVFIAFLIGTASLIMATPGTVAGFKIWNITNVNEDNVVIHYNVSPNEDVLPDYTFGWLPVGYDIEGESSFSNTKLVAAKNSKGNEVFLVYQTMSGDSDLSIGAKGIGLQQKNILLKGTEAILFYDEALNSASILTWTEGQLLFYVQARLPEEELVRISEKIIKK